MTSDGVVDVLVVGGGPAGLTVATTLVRQLHTLVLFDSGVYRNGRSSHIHNVPTWDHGSPADFRAKARKDLAARYHTTAIEDVKIASISKTEDGLFEAKAASGASWKGRKVVLASGVEDEYPDIPGYEECWARGVFHCLFCHGYEERGGASAGVLAVGICTAVPHVQSLGRNAARLADVVNIYTNGSTELADQLRAAFGADERFNFDARRIEKLVKLPEAAQVRVVLDDGSERVESFLAHAPKTHARGPFAEQLQLEMTPSGDIVSKPPFSQSSVKGVFVAGDNMNPFKIAPYALSTGAVAAAGVSHQLQAEADGHTSMV